MAEWVTHNYLTLVRFQQGPPAPVVERIRRLATDEEIRGLSPLGRSRYGVCGVVVCTNDCGSLGLGSIPSRHPKAGMVFNGNMLGFHPSDQGSSPCIRSNAAGCSNWLRGWIANPDFTGSNPVPVSIASVAEFGRLHGIVAPVPKRTRWFESIPAHQKRGVLESVLIDWS